jgi:hypothetical protein
LAREAPRHQVQHDPKANTSEKRGRKKGQLNRRTLMLRAVADGAIKPGKTPLDIMLKNMRYYDDKAEAAMKWLEAKMANAKSQPLEVIKLLTELSEYRMNAQKCAVEAAPYVHPRLATIEHVRKDEAIKAKPESDMSEEELEDYYSKLRLRPTTHVPLVIDNDTSEVVADEIDHATAD